MLVTQPSSAPQHGADRGNPDDELLEHGQHQRLPDLDPPPVPEQLVVPVDPEPSEIVKPDLPDASQLQLEPFPFAFAHGSGSSRLFSLGDCFLRNETTAQPGRGVNPAAAVEGRLSRPCIQDTVFAGSMQIANSVLALMLRCTIWFAWAHQTRQRLKAHE
jgi:hypothetical protein